MGRKLVTPADASITPHGRRTFSHVVRTLAVELGQEIIPGRIDKAKFVWELGRLPTRTLLRFPPIDEDLSRILVIAESSEIEEFDRTTFEFQRYTHPKQPNPVGFKTAVWVVGYEFRASENEIFSVSVGGRRSHVDPQNPDGQGYLMDIKEDGRRARLDPPMNLQQPPFEQAELVQVLAFAHTVLDTGRLIAWGPK